MKIQKFLKLPNYLKGGVISLLFIHFIFLQYIIIQSDSFEKLTGGDLIWGLFFIPSVLITSYTIVYPLHLLSFASLNFYYIDERILIGNLHVHFMGYLALVVVYTLIGVILGLMFRKTKRKNNF